MRKLAVTSSDLKPGYYFQLPIITRLWKRCEYRLLCFLVGSPTEWQQNKQAAYCVEQAVDAGMEIAWVPVPEGYPTSTAAQVSRAFGFLAPQIQDDDYLFTTDADMWPLNHHWYNRQDWTKAVHVTYADAYRHNTWPMCHIGMTAGLWRTVLRPQADQIGPALKFEFDAGLGVQANKTKQWNFDERLVTDRIQAWMAQGSGNKNSVQLMKRGGNPPVDRYSRYHFAQPQLIKGKVDAHVKKATPHAYLKNHFEPCLGFVAAPLLPWFRDYAKKFVEFMP